MNNATPIAAAWNAILAVVAALDLLYGSGKIAGAIIAGMFIAAIAAALAARFVDTITDVLPWATAFSGTLFAIGYWGFRAMVWLDQAAA